jgi:hypothetical protein
MSALKSRDCRLINAALCAYSIASDKTLPTTTDGFAEVGFDTSEPITCFISGDDAINAGYVARTTDNKLLVVFRGTVHPFEGNWHRWVGDWLNDFRIGRVDWAGGSNPRYGMVEKGFGDATLSLWHAGMQSEIARRMKEKTPEEIWVTGHSKGAAMGPLGATLVHHDQGALAPVKTVVFAQPMTCDQAFRDSFIADGLNDTMVRYQNEWDLIPFLPEYWSWDLFGTETEVENGAELHEASRKIAYEMLSTGAWAYVDIGHLKYIKHDCKIFDGHYGEARTEMIKAILELKFQTIVEAHSAKGRYRTCVCG